MLLHVVLSQKYAKESAEGAELLNLAKRYSVHLSFIEHPLKLRAKGLQGSLKRLQGYIDSFKKVSG